jgi:hypothetical protein
VSSTLVINSWLERARVVRAIKRSRRLLRQAKLFSDKYGLPIDLVSLTDQIIIWEGQVEAWRRSLVILRSSKCDLRDLQELVYLHMVRNNMSDHPKFQPAMEGELKVRELVNLLEEFGYRIDGTSVSIEQIQPIVEAAASEAENQPATVQVDPPASEKPRSTYESRMREHFGPWVDDPEFMFSYELAMRYARILYNGVNYDNLMCHAKTCRQPICMRAGSLFAFALDELVREQEGVQQDSEGSNAPAAASNDHQAVVMSPVVKMWVGDLTRTLAQSGHQLDHDDVTTLTVLCIRL